MKDIKEPIEVRELSNLNTKGLDDIFVCCASFEKRCISSVYKLADDFQTEFSIIFVIEEPLYEKEIGEHLIQLRNELTKKSKKGVFVISCERQNPLDGITQFKIIWEHYDRRRIERPFVTIDLSGFTKIFLLELLYYFKMDFNLVLGRTRIIHTTQKYLPTKLTRGVEQIITAPSFFGEPSPEKETLLVLFLGFEPERALSVWEHFCPLKTIVLVCDPPREEKYREYCRKHNSYLLSRPFIELKGAHSDNPYKVSKVLEGIFAENRDSFDLVIGPFGTKSQAVGVFLFWLDHREVQVVYSFPVDYTRSYLRREPGCTLLLPILGDG